MQHDRARVASAERADHDGLMRSEAPPEAGLRCRLNLAMPDGLTRRRAMARRRFLILAAIGAALAAAIALQI